MHRCPECGQLILEQGIVVIAENELQSLLDRASKGGRTGLQHRHKSRSKIANDAELAAFIRERASECTGDEMRQACLEEFGSARAPSRSAIFRYLDMIAESPGE